MYCIKCGKKLDDWMLFCTGCGAKMPRADETDEEKPSFQVSIPESEKETESESSEELYSADDDLYASVQRCIFCGKEMEEGEEFCTHCGQKRSTSGYSDSDQERSDCTTDPVPESGLLTATEPDDRQEGDSSSFCTKCGKKIEEWMSFCTGCGAVLASISPEEQDDPQALAQWDNNGFSETEEQEELQEDDQDDLSLSAVHYLPLEETVFCTNCGNKVERWMEFCPSCGILLSKTSNDLPPEEPLSTEEHPKNERQKVKRSKAEIRTIGIIIGAISVFVAVVFGLFAFLYNQCQLCGRWFFGEPYTLIRDSDVVAERIYVCKDCYETYGIVGSEEKAENYVGVSVQSETHPALSPGTPETLPKNNEENQIDQLSDESIRLANVFLSNFSELGIQKIERNDENAVLDFAIKHDLANYNDYTALSADDQFYSHVEALGNVKFIFSIPEDIIRKKVSRFFGTAPADQTTDMYYYSNGRYYADRMPAATYPYFSSVYSYSDNGNGTVTFMYKVFESKTVESNGFPNRAVYKGTAETKENRSVYSYIYSALAVLEKADIGKGYAPYRMVSIQVV